MSDGPFTDEMVGHLVKTAQTHEAIRVYGEAMAEFLAEAAVASEQAVGDNALYALKRWIDVIGDRARIKIGEKRRKADLRALGAPGVVEHNKEKRHV